MKKLLLIIDAQQQFIPQNEEGRRFTEKIESLQLEYKHIAISKFINHTETFWVKYLQWNKMMEGDPSAELAFQPAKNAFIYKNDSFSSVNDTFLKHLKQQKIEEIHICGADTDACILATAYDLWDNKIPFQILINYCISSAGEVIHSSAQHLMNKNFGFDIVIGKDKK